MEPIFDEDDTHPSAEVSAKTSSVPETPESKGPSQDKKHETGTIEEGKDLELGEIFLPSLLSDHAVVINNAQQDEAIMSK